VLGYARKSESNVRRQTGLEEARVRAGGGVSTDVLQAKTQLAGAQARSIQAQGQRSTSLNRYLRLFRTAPASVKTMAILDLVVQKLPKNLTEALKIARRLNPRIRIASVDEVLARETVKEAKGDEYFPRIEAVGKTKLNNDVSGTLGRETGSSILVQLRMPFNLGFTSINTLRANQSEVAAASYRVANARLEVEEAVRNAWTQYNTARSTARLLRDQASLANAFLQNARKERQLGSRSLIDVLAGESALFNAKSDTISTDADVLVACFRLLNATGQVVGSKPDSHKVKN
jgi:adhesin transport system outer membrane protein